MPVSDRRLGITERRTSVDRALATKRIGSESEIAKESSWGRARVGRRERS